MSTITPQRDESVRETHTPVNPTDRSRANARVLHVINGEHYAGAERVQDLLAAALPANGFDVAFACVKPDQFPVVRHTLDIPLYECPMRARFDLRPARQLAALIKAEKLELVHTHTPRAALVGRVASLIAGVPMVHHVHSPTDCDSTHAWRNWANAWSERLSMARVSGVIAVSHSLEGYAARMGVRRPRIATVPNGVPTRGPLSPRATPTGVWTVGMVALFRPRKGLEVLLDALAGLKSDGAPVRLLAVGSFETPEYEAEIKQRASDRGLTDAIEWTGFTTDVNAQLDRMDVFVLPSLFGEGLPMVVLESMAAGVPVIASRVEGIPEVIRQEVDGVVVEPNSVVELGLAISRVISGDLDWGRLREEAHQRQAEHFSDRSMAEGVARVYRKVLGR